MPTNKSVSPSATALTIHLDGDLIQDVLIPHEAQVPMSTKDPALCTVSSVSDHLMRPTPGGVWTQRKVLCGINQAWQKWETDKNKTRANPILEFNKQFPRTKLPRWAKFKSDEVGAESENDLEASHQNWHYVWAPHNPAKPVYDECYQFELKMFPQAGPLDTKEVLRCSNITPCGNPVRCDQQHISKWSEGGNVHLHVISDYDIAFRYKATWDKHVLAQENQRAEGFPARIIMLGSSLPFEGKRPLYERMNEEASPATPSKDAFWRTLLEDDIKGQNEMNQGWLGTVVIVGVDMLRLASADVAYDLSWDRILEDFNREKKQCEQLRQLCKFEHLIVRIGVSGVIYHYRTRNRQNDGFEDDGQTLLIYDPIAPRIWYRAPDQGNILASRSALVSCIVARLARQRLSRPGEISESPRSAIIRGAKDAVCFMQELHKRGFGDDPSQVQTFTTSAYYEKIYTETVLCAGEESIHKLEEKKSSAKQASLQRLRKTHLPQRNRYITQVHAPVDTSPMEWGIIRNTLRMGVPEGSRLNDYERHVAIYAEQRRLWLAMKIVMEGPDTILNSPIFHDQYREQKTVLTDRIRSQPPTSQAKEILKLLESGAEWDIPTVLICKMPCENLTRDLLRYLSLIYPFNAPLARFGNLIALGQADVETYTNIRNLFTNHLRHGKQVKGQKPLNIAVFGGPGSGKSFGVKQIAKELGMKTELAFNVSQFRSKNDLDHAFMRVSDALARRSPGEQPPLVFFDEFDCSSPDGVTEFLWMSYFLEPMQDGTYQHPSGSLTLGNTIFVFAGGIHASYREFQDRAVGFGSEEKRHLAKIRKFPDFVSRLRGFIDIGSLNRKESFERYSPNEREIPYVHRALTLRSMLERADCVNRKGEAQIDMDVVEAFLTISRYQHGKRSLESLVSMCVRIKEQIVQSSFPSQYQLDMHTWGGEFKQRMHLPGSHWLTEYLFIPSQVDPLHADLDEVRQWELLETEMQPPLTDPRGTIQTCVEELLSKLCQKEAEIWLRADNLLKANERLLTSLLDTIPRGGDGSLEGWTRPYELIPDGATGFTLKEEIGWKTNLDWPASLRNRDLVVIPLVMLEEVRPIQLRLVWRRKDKHIMILSDSTRLAHEVSAFDSKPRPDQLWNKQWEWKKSDKYRVLRHILKNFYVAVHGEPAWERYLPEPIIPDSTISRPFARNP